MHVKLPRLNSAKLAEIVVNAIESQDDGRPGKEKLAGAAAVVARECGLNPEGAVYEFIEGVVQNAFDAWKARRSGKREAAIAAAVQEALEPVRAALADAVTEREMVEAERVRLNAEVASLAEQAERERDASEAVSAKLREVEAERDAALAKLAEAEDGEADGEGKRGKAKAKK